MASAETTSRLPHCKVQYIFLASWNKSSTRVMYRCWPTSIVNVNRGGWSWSLDLHGMITPTSQA